MFTTPWFYQDGCHVTMTSRAAMANGVLCTQKSWKKVSSRGSRTPAPNLACVAITGVIEINFQNPCDLAS